MKFQISKQKSFNQDKGVVRIKPKIHELSLTW